MACSQKYLFFCYSRDILTLILEAIHPVIFIIAKDWNYLNIAPFYLIINPA